VTELSVLFRWVLWTSAQATVLVCLILAIQGLLRHRLNAGWRYGLWLVLLARMVIPWTPLSQAGLLNLTHLVPGVQEGVAALVPRDVTGGMARAGAGTMDDGAAPAAEIESSEPESGPRMAAEASESKSEPGPGLVGLRMLPLLWLVGALVLAGLALLRSFSFSARLSGRPVTDPEVLELLEDCKRELGVRALIVAVRTPRVNSPALLGFIRPWLLLPEGMLERLSPEDLRSVLLHELAHLKRRDIAVNWLVSVLQVLHWFNPIVWYAFYRMRTDREVACDAFVLSHAHTEEPKRYGRTIVNLLESLPRPQRLAGMVGILENSGDLKRRIRMIAQFPIRSRWASAIGVAVLVALCSVSLTSAQPAASPETPTPQPTVEGIPEGCVLLTHVDDTSEGKRSIGASGHAVMLERRGKFRFVEAVQILAGRYGLPEPPDEDFHLYILNSKQQVLADVRYPYGMIERADLKWYTLRTPSIEVPGRFYIALSFNPHKTKGIYLGFDKSVAESHSLTGLPDSGFEKVKERYDWMVRVFLLDKPSGAKGTQRLADWRAPKVVDPFKGCIEAKYDKGRSGGKQSYGGRGPAIKINFADFLPEGIEAKDLTLKGIRLYASRYGSGYEPEKTLLKLSVLGADGKVLRQATFAYSLFSYKQKWVNLVLSKPLSLGALPEGVEQLTLAIDPEANQYKGIYFHYGKNPKVCHSLAGTVKNGFQETPDREWMMRAYFAKGSGGETGD